ncbi:MAG: hypothetical protein KIT63_13730 [Rhodoferax sp.]|nr:hypothetical protein [Rhodoferax sp.]
MSGASLRISGFGTLGLTHANAPAGWGYRRDIAQPANDGGTRGDVDSRLGVQFNYAPTPQFELVAQLVATRRSRYAPSSDAIEWAFAAYRPQPSVAVRVGRLNIDSFLLADYRNVGFAYRFARPPVDFYGSLPFSLDGIDVAKDFQFEDGRWRLKGFAGRSSSGDLSADSRVVVKPVYGVTVSRESNGLTLRAGMAYAGLATRAPALDPLVDALGAMSAVPVPDVAAQARAFHSRLDNSGKFTRYMSLGMGYETPDWLWTLELTRVNGSGTSGFTAGYAGVGRRFGAVTVFGGVSRISTSGLPVVAPDWATALTPVLGPAAAAQAQVLASSAAYAINGSGANQQTVSLGLRWDFQPQMSLKLQWDRIRTDAYGGRLWSNSTLASGHANVTSVVLDFVF